MPREKIEASRRQVVRFWDELRSAIQRLSLDFTQLVVYQDALPVVPGHQSGLELKIVHELAAVGSANHLLLEWLIEQGATLKGTESAELLVAEYTLVRKSIGLADASQPLSEDGSESEDTIADQLADLLTSRDQFIAERIDKTLLPNQTGIIFLGMLHHLEKWLPDDVHVKYPMGRPVSPSTIDSENKLPLGS
jgi:hypothetical protein